MDNPILDLQSLKDIPYFDLLEIATNEQDIEKRQALFEYSNEVLAVGFMRRVNENQEKGYQI